MKKWMRFIAVFFLGWLLAAGTVGWQVVALRAEIREEKTKIDYLFSAAAMKEHFLSDHELTAIRAWQKQNPGKPYRLDIRGNYVKNYPNGMAKGDDLVLIRWTRAGFKSKEEAVSAGFLQESENGEVVVSDWTKAPNMSYR